jgi:hypothetical protein
MLAGAFGAQSEQTRVGFSVDMNPQIRLGSFQPGSGDCVVIRGTFNKWKGDEYLLSDPDHDGIYTGEFGFDTAVIPCEYKYAIVAGNKRSLTNNGWESIKNRTRERQDKYSPNLPADSFDDVRHLFEFRALLKVNMGNQIAQETFDPAEGDRLVVRGTFNSWEGNTYVLERLNKQNWMYGIALNACNPSQLVEFKFAVVPRTSTTMRNDLWEGSPNRAFKIDTTVFVSPVYFFANQKGSVLFRVSLQKQFERGTFDPRRGDSVAIVLTMGASKERLEWMADEAPKHMYSIGLSFGGREGLISYRYCIVNGKTHQRTVESAVRKARVTISGTKLKTALFSDANH